MECHLFGLLIQRYYDDDLGAVERAEYENHRRTCAPCLEKDRQFAAVFNSLGNIPLFEPAEDFNEKVLSRVDISRYRASAIRKAMNALGAAWDWVPTPVRVGTVLAGAFVLFITAYRPFLDLMIAVGNRTLTFFGSGLILIKELAGRSETLIKYFGSANNLKVAGETLLRTMQKLIATIPVSHVALVTAAVLIALVIIIRTARVAWKRGETHVGIF